MEPETNSASDSIVDKAKAQIDALKTKEGRDVIKDKAKESIASATTAAKEQFDALKTKEGRDALKDKAKEGVEAIRRSGIVQAIIAKIKEEIANVKAWSSVNWGNGRYGKFRVLVVSVIILLAVRGLFFGWGSSGNDASANQSMSACSSESSAASSYQPETHLYACKHCGNQIRSSSWPTGFKCPMRPQRPAGRARLPNLPCEWQRMD